MGEHKEGFKQQCSRDLWSSLPLQYLFAVFSCIPIQFTPTEKQNMVTPSKKVVNSLPYRNIAMSTEAGNLSDQSVTQKTPKTVRAVFHDAPGKVSVRHVPFPELIEPEDAIVRITTSAICGSDLHNYRGFYGPETYPYRAGHEAMGVVHKIGPAVDSLKVGDRVVIAFPDDHPIRLENSTFPQDIDFFFNPEFGLQSK